MNTPIQICLNSETAPLEAVILHKPGPEVENMTPANAERALYSDILNLSIASREYEQLKGVLDRVSRTFEVSDLLTDILSDSKVKEKMVTEICRLEEIRAEAGHLLSLEPALLARQLIEGVPLVKNTLTRYLSEERYLLRPLHNLFFTRDTAMAYNGNILIGKMASRVRERESLIMESIFNHHPGFATTTLNPAAAASNGIKGQPITLEGGDFQVAAHNVLVIGTGVRTSSQGIDYIIRRLCEMTRETRHIIVQELPEAPESFIHLDMVFTFLDNDACMVYEPIITEQNRFRTIHIRIDNGRVVQIGEEPNILSCLKKLNLDLQPVACGGKADTWVQEREQWHSGANFFAFAPGKVIGYTRNIHTLHELNSSGFEVITADDVISGKKDPADYTRCVVTIEGSELARGGGGARCMTLPVRRKP